MRRGTHGQIEVGGLCTAASLVCGDDSQVVVTPTGLLQNTAAFALRVVLLLLVVCVRVWLGVVVLGISAVDKALSGDGWIVAGAEHAAAEFAV